MMALYFFSVGLGTSMSGVLARYYAPTTSSPTSGSSGPSQSSSASIVFAIAPWISRLMEGVH